MYNDNKFLNIYFDTEFTGLTQNTTLISIGCVTEDDDKFYAELTDYDTYQLNNWLKENVINNLILSEEKNDYIETKDSTENETCITLAKGDKVFVGRELKDWLQHELNKSKKSKIRMFCDCYAYDWVLFNNLVTFDGDALHIPSYIYYIPVDLSTVFALYDIDPDITREDFLGINDDNSKIYGNKHNALIDAMICKGCFKKIERKYRN